MVAWSKRPYGSVLAVAARCCRVRLTPITGLHLIHIFLPESAITGSQTSLVDEHVSCGKQRRGYVYAERLRGLAVDKRGLIHVRLAALCGPKSDVPQSQRMAQPRDGRCESRQRKSHPKAACRIKSRAAITQLLCFPRGLFSPRHLPKGLRRGGRSQSCHLVSREADALDAERVILRPRPWHLLITRVPKTRAR